MDSIRQAIAEKALRDSLPDMEMPTELVDTLALDSLFSDSVLAERGLILPADSLASDTARKKKDGLEAPVQYEAKDSIWYFMDTGNIYMYGEGNVKYQNME